MRLILIIISLSFLSISAQAHESSECESKSKWQTINSNSKDIRVRKCELFGLSFLEVKSELEQDRCIKISNKESNKIWKQFYLHQDSVKSLGSVYSSMSLSKLKVTSIQTKHNLCK
jgi:hypothetical protein